MFDSHMNDKKLYSQPDIDGGRGSETNKPFEFKLITSLGA